MQNLQDVFPIQLEDRGTSISLEFRNHHHLMGSSCAEQTISRWAVPLVKINASLGATIPDSESLLRALESAAQGKLNSWIFQDALDHSVTSVFLEYFVVSSSGDLPTGAKSRGVTFPLEGDGSRLVFQLCKQYLLECPSGDSLSVYRPITEVIAEDFQVYVDGVPVFPILDTLGQITFSTPPSNNSRITWSGYFNIRVRFDSDAIATRLAAIHQPGNSNLNLYERTSIPLIQVRTDAPSPKPELIGDCDHVFMTKMFSIGASKTEEYLTMIKSLSSGWENRYPQKSTPLAKWEQSQLNAVRFGDAMYLITLFRCTLGGAISFRHIGVRDTFPAETFRVKFAAPFTVQTVQHGRRSDQLVYGQYDVQGCQLRESIPIVDGPEFYQKSFSISVRCWLITRNDGQFIGATQYNQSITIPETVINEQGDEEEIDVTYYPQNAFNDTASTITASFSTDNSDAVVPVNFGQIEERDLVLGVYDNALIEEFYCNPQAETPTKEMVIRRGFLGDMELEYAGQLTGVTFKFEGLSTKLTRKYSTLTTKLCPVPFGSSKCGFHLPDVTHTGVGIENIHGATEFSIDQDLVHLVGGRLTFDPGTSNEGQVFVIGEQRDRRITLFRRPKYAILATDTFTIEEGCEHTLSFCRDVRNNSGNFQGTPNTPRTRETLATQSPT